MVIGFLIKYIGRESSTAIERPNCTISGATKKLYLKTVNGSQYSYLLSGPAQGEQDNELDQKVYLHCEWLR